MSSDTLIALATLVGEKLKAQGAMLATAESCTGGWVAQAVTAIAGSSDWFDRGFVTYSNAAKQEMLGVPAETLAAHGAVSEPTARAMAEGALARSAAAAAVAVTGVAGPGGGSPGKPVGLVHLAVAVRDGATRHRRMLYGDIGRSGIRHATVLTAFEMLTEAVGDAGTGTA